MAISGRPIPGHDPSIIMNASDPETRMAIMQQMGVVNAAPPLPHSPCLKNKITGLVFPWNELLAEQRDIMACCDEFGNTDPSVWEPKVVHTPERFSQEMLTSIAQQRMVAQKDSQKLTNMFEHYMPEAKQQTGPSDYEKKGAIPNSAVKSKKNGKS